MESGGFPMFKRCLVLVLAVVVIVTVGAVGATTGDRASAAPVPAATMASWGDNASGELGIGTLKDSDVPVAVTGLAGVTALAGGDGFSLALLSDGTVDAWGDNNLGELGQGTDSGPDTCPSDPIGPACSTTPTPVPGLNGVKAIAAMDLTGLALMSNGTVKSWGDNIDGELGDGVGTKGPEMCGDGWQCSMTPVKVKGLAHVKAIAGGGISALALLSKGTVKAWGDNSAGELGNGSSRGPKKCEGAPCATRPVTVKGLTDVTAIAVGGLFSLALLSDGTVMAWGLNSMGQVGNGTTAPDEGCVCVDRPAAVSDLTGVEAIAGGTDDGLALLTTGTVEEWGSNDDGQFGNGNTTGSDMPEPAFSGEGGFSAVAAGDDLSAGVRDSGVVGAGNGLAGQLGNGAMTNSDVPVVASGLSGVTVLDSGFAHVMAVSSP